MYQCALSKNCKTCAVPLRVMSISITLLFLVFRTPAGWMYPPGNVNPPQPHATPSLMSRTNFLRRSGHKSKSTATSYQPSSNLVNYQNCTIVRSHVPTHTNYGAYVKVAPKVLIFPIFVQVSLMLGLSCSQNIWFM